METLIKIKPETDFEKLLFAESLNKELIKRNKELEFDNGVLKSDLDEIRYIEDINRKYLNMKEHLKNINEKLRRLKNTNSNLITELVKLRKPNQY